MSRYNSHRYSGYSMFPQSKSKGERIADAAKKQKALEKKGVKLSPVILEGSKIAATFWGKAWCKNIESYHDDENRLPRGRSYVRSNSVIDLQIAPGVVRAQVMGSSLYRIEITIKPVAKKHWEAIRAACSGKIGSLVALLRGTFSGEVMEVMTRHDEGLFPKPAEISLKCSCPDGAYMCKHVAAAMYGIGSRLDTQPELLFLLRGVDSADLIASAAEAPVADSAAAEGETLASDELAAVFGVDFEAAQAAVEIPASPAKKPRGRPKKAAAPVVEVSSPKKPRGRPKKVAAPVARAPVPKKLRGRPKKTAAPSAVVRGRTGEPRG